MDCRCHPVGNAAKRPRFDTLKHDPTRTVGIRKKFVLDITRRFKKLRADVIDFVRTENNLDLGPKQPGLISNALKRYAFLSDPAKLVAFNAWFKQQVDLRIFTVPAGTDPNKPWTADYAESAYKQGIINAYIATKSGLDQMEFDRISQTQGDFLRTSFGGPEALLKARLLGTRSFEALKGVTATMSSQMNQILAQGMLDGLGVKEIAQQMVDAMDGLSGTRALQIARTEVIRAHAVGQLDALDKLGVKELGLQAEWQTAGDSRVCPICSALAGTVYTIEEASGLIPAHPSCRCSWQPYLTPPN